MKDFNFKNIYLSVPIFIVRTCKACPSVIVLDFLSMKSMFHDGWHFLCMSSISASNDMQLLWFF